MTVSSAVHDVLPEWDAFARAVRSRRPDAGTWCQGWTVRDVLIHQTGNADEMAAVLAGHTVGRPRDTRSFTERERRYRSLSDAELWAAFVARCEEFVDVVDSARDLPGDAAISWTGRTVTPSFFAEHLRQELVLHRWDVTGDDATATRSLAEPWITEHSVNDVGVPLLARGRLGVGLGAADRIEGRLRAPGTDDVLITAGAQHCAIGMVEPQGVATIESDPAARTLLLWGRRPADPSRWRSQAGPETLNRLRGLLSGY